MDAIKYVKASKYTDLNLVYSQCSGPGGLKVVEFIADKMKIKSGKKLLDIGFNRGYQTCFLAKEYDLFLTIGIDPWNDRKDKRPHIEYLMENAKEFKVEDRILGIKVGVPETLLPNNYFDYVYSTTTFEMIRGIQGIEMYLECLKEVHRLLKPGGIFGLGEPMHLDKEIPNDIKPFITEGKMSFEKCFATIDETRNAVELAGFKIIEANYAEDATKWWEEYAKYDPFCNSISYEEKKTIEADKGRWLSFGYVIAEK
jgi:cyclopropane fatty-acyl-phospholipid synthase-like methyltransferase